MSEWLSKIFKYAPRVATAIATGGTSEIIKVGLAVAGEALTGEAVETKEELKTVIEAATPEQLLMLKNADAEYELRVLNLQVEERANTREAITQSAKYADLVDFAARNIITYNMLYVMALVATQVAAVVLASKYLGNDANTIIALISTSTGAAIHALFKERQDMTGLLSGALPSKDGPTGQQFKIPVADNEKRRL